MRRNRSSDEDFLALITGIAVVCVVLLVAICWWFSRHPDHMPPPEPFPPQGAINSIRRF
jgi:hypothetical protein